MGLVHHWAVKVPVRTRAQPAPGPDTEAVQVREDRQTRAAQVSGVWSSWGQWWTRQVRHRAQISSGSVCKGQVPEVHLDGAGK